MFRTIAASLQARNPFYLLSALSMLGGCYVLSQSLGLQPGHWKPLIVLIGVLQLYELLLIGLGAYLLGRAAVPRDGRTVLLLEVLFLVDATYLNSEMALADPWTAPFVAAAHLILAALKLIWIRRVLGPSSRRSLAVVLAQLAVLFFTPCALSAVHFMDSNALGSGREMLPLAVYGLWWLVGALPVAFLWVERAREGTIVSRALLYAPFVSLVLHILSLQWMFDVAFRPSHLTPLILGISVHVAYRPFRESFLWAEAVKWLGVPLAAVFSVGPVEELVFILAGPSVLPDVVVSPLRLALLGGAAVFIAHRVLSDDPVFAWAACVPFALFVSGPSFHAMRRLWSRLVPETAAELGVAAMIGAFAFLALALAVSLWRPDETASRRGW